MTDSEIVGYDKTNRPRLLFSLKQVEYIQYYINAMRLSTPSWVEYYQRRAELIADGGQESLAELEEMEEPSYEDGRDDWIPIPDMVLPAELFIKIVCLTPLANCKVLMPLRFEGRNLCPKPFSPRKN